MTGRKETDRQSETLERTTEMQPAKEKTMCDGGRGRKTDGEIKMQMFSEKQSRV